MINRYTLLILSIFFIHLSINTSYAIEPDEILENKEYEIRARNISKNIRCMVCQNQSIDDSNASLAKDLRILIRSQILIGKSDKEIYEFLTERYGDFILLKPPIKTSTLALWFLPMFFLIFGVLIIFFYNKKSKNG